MWKSAGRNINCVPNPLHPMEDLALKQSVLEAARARMEVTILELKERIEDLQAVTIGDDNAESASQTESTHGSDVELMNSLREQREHLQQEIDRLIEIDPQAHLQKIQYGAVVHTDKRNFLIAASVEEFQVNDRRYLGVTSKAPLIQAMMGHEQGEVVSFNGMDYKIEAVI